MTDREKIAAWEEPPVSGPSNNPQQRYADVVADLRANPGKWAKLEPRDTEQAARSLQANIRKGRLASFTPEGAFDARYQGVNVWVCFIGEPEDGPVKTDAATAKLVRTWAEANGYHVPARGPISRQLLLRWREATRGNGHVEHEEVG